MKLSDLFGKEKVIRDMEFEVLGLVDSHPEKAMLTFIETEKFFEKLVSNKNVSCVIANPTVTNKIMEETNLGIVVTESARSDFFKLHNQLATSINYKREEFKTKVGKNCVISNLACISNTNVRIGDNVIIEEFVSIKENVSIGDGCIIRAGAVIGGTGFEFKRDNDQLFLVKHLGGVKLENDVEVQHYSAIDKGVYPWDDTLIGRQSKIDNLVHVGHAAKIGIKSLLAAGSIIGGRAEIGDNVWVGIGAVISNNIKVGDCSRCNIGSIVTRDVGINESVSGNFAINHERFLDHIKRIR